MYWIALTIWWVFSNKCFEDGEIRRKGVY